MIVEESIGSYDVLPPSDDDAEKCVLASAMLDSAVFAEIRAVITARDFYNADHEIIWKVLCDMADDKRPVDALTLRTELESRQILKDVGGTAYLGALFNTVPSASNGVHYAKIVRDKSLLRQLISVSNEYARKAYAPREIGGGEDLITSAMTRLGSIISGGNSTKFRKISEVAQEVRAEIENFDSGMLEPTGFADLDSLVGGIAKGEMVVVAARPSMGKSTLGRGIAWRRAKQGHKTGIISLEESSAKITRNILAAEGSVENNRIRRKSLTAEDICNIDNAMGKMDAPLWIADKSFRINAIKATAAEMVARHGVSLIIVDYLQRVITEGRDRYTKVTEASLSICEMIKELNVAGVVLAQLNRGVEGREDKRPCMSDLRESGQIEQDADGIIFIHREDYYHIDSGSYTPNYEVELIIAKWRDGVRGKVIKLTSNLQYQRFDDVIPEIIP